MDYKDIIARSLQHSAITGINIHPIDGLFVMEINYDIIVDAIIEDLNKSGYKVVKFNSLEEE